MEVAKQLKQVVDAIRSAEKKYQRELGSVQLLAISKTYSSQHIREAYQAGQAAFGESYLQEALVKQIELADLDIEWHFVGTIQSNKTKLIAEHFSWVHSVNRFKVAKRLDEQRPANLGPLNVCVEVNVSREKTKTGIDPSELMSFAQELSCLRNLRWRGLMVIPEHAEGFLQQKEIFSEVAHLQQQLVAAGFDLDTLSMGMTQDYEAAIAEGSNLVRIGTGIFGSRVNK